MEFFKGKLGLRIKHRGPKQCGEDAPVESFSVGSVDSSSAPVVDGGLDGIGLLDLGTIALSGQLVDTANSSLEDGGEFCKVNAGSVLEVGDSTLDSFDDTGVVSGKSHGGVLNVGDLALGEVFLSNPDDLIDSGSYVSASEGLGVSGDLVEDGLSLSSGGGGEAGDLRGSPSDSAGSGGVLDADGGSSGSKGDGEDDGVHVDRF